MARSGLCYEKTGNSRALRVCRKLIKPLPRTRNT